MQRWALPPLQTSLLFSPLPPFLFPTTFSSCLSLVGRKLAISNKKEKKQLIILWLPFPPAAVAMVTTGLCVPLSAGASSPAHRVFPCPGKPQKATFGFPSLFSNFSQPPIIPAFSVSYTQEVERTVPNNCPQKQATAFFHYSTDGGGSLAEHSTVSNRNLSALQLMKKTLRFTDGETETQKREETDGPGPTEGSRACLRTWGSGAQVSTVLLFS